MFALLLTEALRVTLVSFCYVLLVLAAIIQVNNPILSGSVQELGRCIIIATTDCRCKRVKEKGVLKSRVPVHLCIRFLVLTPIGRSSPNVFLPCCIRPAGENTAGFGGTSCRIPVKSLEVRVLFSFLSLPPCSESPLSFHCNPAGPC